MNYQKNYNLLIEKYKNLNIQKSKEINLEKHHILPKSMGGTNNKENLVNLTVKAHFVAHHLLWKIHRNKEMAFAFWRMVNNKNINLSMYVEAKNNFIKFNKGETAPNYGKKHTEKTKNQISVTMKKKNLTGKNNYFYGKKHTEKTKKMYSLQRKGKTRPQSFIDKMKTKMKGENNPMFGKKISEEHKEKIREANRKRKGLPSPNKGKPQDKSQCPFCMKIGGKSNMKRYHFNNCRSNPRKNQ